MNWIKQIYGEKLQMLFINMSKIIIINQKMQLKKTIMKSLPFDIVSIVNSPNDDLIVKGLFEEFVELRNQDQIIDVMSLPPELRMAKIQLSIDQGSCKYNKSQHLFTRNQTLFIGSPDAQKFNICMSHISISDSIFMSNPVNIKPSQYCNISSNHHNESKINLLSFEQNTKIRHKQVPLSYNISHTSNLSFSNDRMFYVSNNPISQSIICYDLQMQAVDSCVELPEIQMQTGMNCFLVPQSDQKFKQILCAHGRDWLGIADIRMKSIICLQKLYDCQNVFTLPEQNAFKLYYTEGKMIYQFDIRKNSSQRIAFLSHNENILNANVLNKKLLKIEDNCTCGVHLYQKSNQ